MSTIRIPTILVTIGLLAGSLVCVPASRAQEFQLDPAHSHIGFAVRHMMVSTTHGAFRDFKGTIVFDRNKPEDSVINAVIQSASIDTRQAQRDKHLRSADFLGVEQFPTITFQSKSLKPSSRANEYILTGDLTIKDVTKEISFPVTISGPITGMSGGQVIGLQGKTSINRQDFHVSWSKQLDNGGLVVDNTVMIDVDVEGHQQQASDDKR